MASASGHELFGDLLEAIRPHYALSWDGIHGLPHWTRVRENGLRLAERTGADARIVVCFAVLHDSMRRNDGIDPGHGRRAARFAESLRGELVHMSDGDFELLQQACRYHTDGLMRAHVTVQTCWDADRLDLGRVHIRPDPARLCTQAARDPELLEWAFARSQGGL
jgi:uncharacterized protein